MDEERVQADIVEGEVRVAVKGVNVSSSLVRSEAGRRLRTQVDFGPEQEFVYELLRSVLLRLRGELVSSGRKKTVPPVSWLNRKDGMLNGRRVIGVAVTGRAELPNIARSAPEAAPVALGTGAEHHTSIRITGRVRGP